MHFLKSIKYILLLVIIPFTTFAQDTTALKKQAVRFANATFNSDHKLVIDLTYPKLITLSGGRDSMQKLIVERIAALKKQGIIKFEGMVGSPGPFITAGKQVHCLIPEIIVLKMYNGRYVTRTYLLAISDDKGKSWTFMDVGKMPGDVLHKLLPNYNNDLLIPTPGKPMFFLDGQ
jgi:hypothetical protein